jgi:two-component system, NtrC family, nitrogen regulation sensor histidine kinase NtrY
MFLKLKAAGLWGIQDGTPRGVPGASPFRYDVYSMRRRLALASAGISFLVLFALVIWQGSFSFGSYAPADVQQTSIIWAVSTVIFLLFVTLAFMLFRTSVKLYIDRQSNREGSRIRSKLIFGALAMTLTPVLFSVLFSVYVLNRNLDKWFSRPARHVELNLQQVDQAFRTESQDRAQSQADWLSLLPQTRKAAQTGEVDREYFLQICTSKRIASLQLSRADGSSLQLCQTQTSSEQPLLDAQAIVVSDGTPLGTLTARSAMGTDLAAKQTAINRYLEQQKQLASNKKYYNNVYFLLICLITLFVLFVASWISQILARQIIVPISALLEAAKEVRQGNLSYRVRVRAMDELATLVRSFNEMTSDLESNARELEARRRLMEAILESIPTGVISVSDDGRIERVNRALRGIFPPDVVQKAHRLEDLFPGEDLDEIRYLMKRARRTGAAGSQLEITRETTILHLALTVASLEERRGFVLVVEDTSELLRAQKAAAWQEVARRIAHEIKNPLTPISLCADRIERQLRKIALAPETEAILNECASTIQQEVQTVKTLVDEFSQFSRFPAAQPVPADLNEIVDSAMAVFADRLDGIRVSLDLALKLPWVLADREQMKRVIVNLVDNAAEAMENSPVKSLLIATSCSADDLVELLVADTGCGISTADKAKLFLPYFSTKQRGTGLGLAIVSHIIAEHRGQVHVEDNHPEGARFIVELLAYNPGEGDTQSIQQPVAAGSETS